MILKMTARTFILWTLMGLVSLALTHRVEAKPKEKHIPLDVAVTHNNQGVQYLTRQDLDKAEWEFKTAVEIDPQYAEAHSNLGLIYKYRGSYPEAIRYFDKATKIDPKWAVPYNHLGTVYIATEEYGKAIESFKRALTKDKKLADAYHNMGIAYLSRSKKESDPKPDWKRAVESLQKATQIDSHLYNAHLELADTYRKLGDWEKAVIRYRVAIETNPNDPTPWQHLCELYQEKGDEAKAAECLLKSQQKSSDDRNVVTLGEGLLKEQRYGEALALFNRALKTDPQNATLHFNIGYTHYAQGQYAAALPAYQEAIRLQPNYLAAYYNLAVTYVALKDFPQAISALEKALLVNPDHPRSLYDLGRLYLQSGRRQEAATTLCRFKKVPKTDMLESGMPEETAIADKLISQLGGC